MSIYVNKKENVFTLETKNTHYVIGFDCLGNTQNIHWGKKCNTEDYSDYQNIPDIFNNCNFDHAKCEYTPFGKTMFRQCAVKAEFSDKCREINLVFVKYITSENELKLIYKDEYYPLEIELSYRTFENYDIIKRTVTLRNTGSDEIIFERLMSAEFTLPGTDAYRIMNTVGEWGCEFTPVDTKLEAGSLLYECRQGRSGHGNSPYFIAYQNADEKSGEVFFANLLWSGNFEVEINRDTRGVSRAFLGMNSFDFEFALGGGEEFTAPEIICGLTEGFTEMSNQLNRFGREYILPKNFASSPLPVLYNSWEATEFDVNTKGQSELAKKAAAAGCELFVMDDGWFGARYDDHAGLGDWFVNEEKFPNGLDELIENVNALGMDFGLWFEPEMVNPDSDLFRAHPDWAYHYEHRKANEIRWQLVLNMTKPEVQEYIFTRLDTLLSDHNIKYIKWDMNRSISESGAENLKHGKMLWYYHTKAVYDIVDRLREKHPDVQFESCSSGGGRCDWGALCHYDMVWTSDNTDSIDRIKIQKNYSLTRPVKTMRAWVTDVNWYNRDTPLAFKFNIAMRGALSLGGNLSKYSDGDIAECKKYVDIYKEIRPLVQFGDMYRLLDIEKDEISAVLYMNGEKSESVLFIAAVNTSLMKSAIPLRFAGLDKNKKYSFTLNSKEYAFGGEFLENVGIYIDIKKQYYNDIIRIKEVS